MRPMNVFAFARLPELRFGVGQLSLLPALVAAKGDRALVLTGASFIARTPQFPGILEALTARGVAVAQAMISGEPSPEVVDEMAERFRGEAIDVVVAIGGGSVLDAGKAISAMLMQEGSVADFLEGVEKRPFDGRKVPFIAVPTSAGTGSEATKNAVLSRVGSGGFKSSLRHDNLVPDVALVDPDLMLSCPRSVTAACGLDALTQLLEAYVSIKASPMTDALALSGLEAVAAGFLAAVNNGAVDRQSRAYMAYAAYASGVALANAGLGVVHGFAGPIGGYFGMPHGEVCGTLIGEATRITIESLAADADRNRIALAKYASAARALCGQAAGSVEEDCEQLVQMLDSWVEQSAMPRLSHYGIRRADFDRIVAKTNGKNSPATLTAAQLAEILDARL